MILININWLYACCIFHALPISTPVRFWFYSYLRYFVMYVCALKSCSIWPKLQDVTFTSAIFMSYAMFYLQSRGAAGDYGCDHIHASYS